MNLQPSDFLLIAFVAWLAYQALTGGGSSGGGGRRARVPAG
jgi:hypothetical protein